MSSSGLAARCTATVAASLELSGLASAIPSGPASAPGFGQQKTLIGASSTNHYGVAVDTTGDVLVANTGNGRAAELTAAGVQVTLGFEGPSHLAGVPLDGVGDVYVMASDHQQRVELPALQIAPPFTSPAVATIKAGRAGSFVATASGAPATTFSETGPLPTGVTLASTGLLPGTAIQVGSCPIRISASNGDRLAGHPGASH